MAFPCQNKDVCIKHLETHGTKHRKQTSWIPATTIWYTAQLAKFSCSFLELLILIFWKTSFQNKISVMPSSHKGNGKITSQICGCVFWPTESSWTPCIFQDTVRDQPGLPSSLATFLTTVSSLKNGETGKPRMVTQP